MKLKSDCCFSHPTFQFFLLTTASVGIWLWSDGLTVELPFLVPYLPEGWKLGSFLTLMKGTSTFALLLLPVFTIRGTMCGIIACYSIGLVASLVICFQWNQLFLKVPGMDNYISIGFLSSAFILMGTDSLRMTMCYMIAAERFEPHFMTAVLLGDGMGGLLTSGIINAQGFKQFMSAFKGTNSQDLNQNTTFKNSTEYPAPSHTDGSLSKDFVFPPHVAFLIMSLLFFINYLALITVLFLRRSPKYLQKFIHTDEDSEEGPLISSTESTRSFTYGTNEECHSDSYFLEDGPPEEYQKRKRYSSATFVSYSRSHEAAIRGAQLISHENGFRNTTVIPESPHDGASYQAKTPLLRDQYRKWLLYLFWAISSGSLFTVVPAIHSFTTLPYSQRCFILAVSGWSITFPVAAILAHNLQLQSIRSLGLLTIFHTLLDICLFVLASYSPDLPFREEGWAEAVIIFVWILEGLSGYYCFSMCSYILRGISEEAVKWGSIAAQLGDIVGSLISFSLINLTNIFPDETGA